MTMIIKRQNLINSYVPDATFNFTEENILMHMKKSSIVNLKFLMFDIPIIMRV